MFLLSRSQILMVGPVAAHSQYLKQERLNKLPKALVCPLSRMIDEGENTC